MKGGKWPEQSSREDKYLSNQYREDYDLSNK